MPTTRTYIVIILGMCLVAIVLGTSIFLRQLPKFWEPSIILSATILTITALVAASIEYNRHKTGK